MGNRQCTVEINNESSFTLDNPRWCIVSGQCSRHPTTSILPAGQGHAFFHKTPSAATGSVAVLTYDLLNISTQKKVGKVAMMFSVPYDYNWYSNWVAVGEFDVKKVCNYALYEEMYYGEEKGFRRVKAKDSPVTYIGQRVTITATMPDTATPVLQVKVTDSPSWIN